MIVKFIDAWNIHKDDLKEYFETTPMCNYDSYEKLVKLVFEKVVNPEQQGSCYFDTEKIKVIDDGSYCGTQIFILHRDTFEPGVTDYIYTNTYYGSCSGCDTLLSILSFDYNTLPNEKQVKDFMTLCLHLLEKCNYLIDG